MLGWARGVPSAGGVPGQMHACFAKRTPLLDSLVEKIVSSFPSDPDDLSPLP